MAQAAMLYHLEAYRDNFHDKKMGSKIDTIDSAFASSKMQKVVESIYNIDR